MLDVYLFINPLGNRCFDAEQNILSVIHQTTEKVNFQINPLVTLDTVSGIINRRHLQEDNMQVRHAVTDEVYQVSLDYEAARFQGKRRGRKFLFALQQLLLIDHQPYSLAVVHQAAEQAGLDWEFFKDDRNSKLAHKSFQRDQQLAINMNAQRHPTVVLENVTGFAYGIALNACESYTIILDIISGHIPVDAIMATHERYEQQFVTTSAHHHHYAIWPLFPQDAHRPAK